MISAFVSRGRMYAVDKDRTTRDIGPVEYSGFFYKELPKRHKSMIAYERQGDWYKVLFKDWELRDKFRQEYEGDSYELDLSSIRRYISDHHSVTIDKPRRLYLDIETDSRVPFQFKHEARILSWAIENEKGEKWSSTLRADTNSCELDLLKELSERIEDYDQICAWNGDGFDFPVLQARYKLYDVTPFSFRRIHWLDHMVCFKRMNSAASKSGEEKTSFALQNIAQELLGFGKIDVEGSKTWELWRDNPKALVEYNAHDTSLLRLIEQKKPFLDLFQSLCEISFVFPNSHGLKPTVQADGIMLRRASKEGIHLPTKKEWPESKFRGAFVLPPQKSGIHTNVRAADWKGLYPSVIRSWNLSPEMKCTDDSCTKDHCLSPLTNVKTHKDKEGRLCAAIREFGDLRAYWQKERDKAILGSSEYIKADMMCTSYKTAVNSLYGIMGSPYSRFYWRDGAESTAQNGKWLNYDIAMPHIESRGSSTIYGDTDSTYNLGATHEEFKTIIDEINNDIVPSKLKELGCIGNYTHLNYDKVFHRLIFPLNNGGKPVSKRYVGWYSKPGQTETDIEIKGLEYKRGDSLRLARTMQEEVAHALAKSDDPSIFIDLVCNWRRRVFDDALPIDDIILSKSLSRDPGEYTADNIPHVRIAKAMLENGEEVRIGSRIRYIVVDASKSPVVIVQPENYKGNVDRFYLWNTLIYPPSMRLLAGAFPDINWTHYISSRPKPSLEGQLELFT
jgi:DNA polymerase I